MRALYTLLGIGLVLGLGTVASAQSGAESGTPVSPAALPKDIDPQSLSRLPLLKRDDLDEAGKRLYNELAGGPDKTVTPTGPVALSLYSPPAEAAMEMMNHHLRYAGALSPWDYEAAIL